MGVEVGSGVGRVGKLEGMVKKKDEADLSQMADRMQEEHKSKHDVRCTAESAGATGLVGLIKKYVD